jgi:hypothetical protein
MSAIISFLVDRSSLFLIFWLFHDEKYLLLQEYSSLLFPH